MTQTTLATLGFIAATALPATARTFVVDNQHPRANDHAAGDAARPLQTINAAAQRAQAGDEIVVHAGVYRETIVPARGGENGKPIVYRAAQPGSVVVKATEIWKPTWKKVEGQIDVYRAPLPVAMLTRFNPFVLPTVTFDGTISRGQVFYAGRPLPEMVEGKSFVIGQVAWRAVDDGRAIALHSPGGGPAELEISTRAALFRPNQRGLGYITLRGFVFEGGANARVTKFWADGENPQAGIVSTRAGHHWVLENNVIRYAKTVGLDCGSEGMHRAIDGVDAPAGVGHHLVRGNIVSDNGQAGIYGSRQIGSRFEGNVIARNNRLRFDNFEEAGMKAHYFVRCVVEGNLFLDNEAEGLWIDNVWPETRVSRNAFIGNRTAGLFMEMGRGPCLIEKNVFGWTRAGFLKRTPNGNGVYSHDASGYTLRDNIMVGNADFGVFIRTVTPRKFRVYSAGFADFDVPHLRLESVGASDITVKQNLIANNKMGIASLRFDGDASGNVFDDNLLGAPLAFQLNSFDKSEQPAPKELVNKPISFESWRELTGHDKGSEPVKVKAEWIEGARPLIRIEAEGPLPDAIREIGNTQGLPFEVEIVTGME